MDDNVLWVPAAIPTENWSDRLEHQPAAAGRNRVFDCKRLEGQWLNVDGWRAREDALQVNDEARRRRRVVDDG